jgi:two-component system chemotaxis response regulator CheY
MPRNLMIVDDSATMRKIIMRTVRMSGLEFDDIQEAGNGAEAIEKLGSNPIDIILCDVNMPEMNGEEMLKNVRASSSHANTKIVMVTTESADDLVARLMEQGANGFIHKPFTPEQFQTLLTPMMA